MTISNYFLCHFVFFNGYVVFLISYYNTDTFHCIWQNTKMSEIYRHLLLNKCMSLNRFHWHYFGAILFTRHYFTRDSQWSSCRGSVSYSIIGELPGIQKVISDCSYVDKSPNIIRKMETANTFIINLKQGQFLGKHRVHG